MRRQWTAKQEYHFVSPPSRVFRALTDPKELVRWFLSSAEIEPRAGGRFAFDWIGGYHMDGEVLAFRRGRSIVLRWVDRMPDGRLAKTRASFRVERKGSGSLLRLEHSEFRSPEHMAECSSRWAYYLTNLKSVLDHDCDLRSPLDW